MEAITTPEKFKKASSQATGDSECESPDYTTIQAVTQQLQSVTIDESLVTGRDINKHGQLTGQEGANAHECTEVGREIGDINKQCTLTHPHTRNTKRSEMAELQELKTQLELQRQTNERISAELEELKIRADIEKEKRKQAEMELQLKLEKERITEEVKKHESKIDSMSKEEGKHSTPAPSIPGSAVDEKTQKIKAIQESCLQQLQNLSKETGNCEYINEISKLLEKVTHATTLDPNESLLKIVRDNTTDMQLVKNMEELIEVASKKKQESQTSLITQLKIALAGGDSTEAGTQKDIIRAFITDNNKTTDPNTGASVLKPDLLKRLTGEKDTFLMQDWLSGYNKNNTEDRINCENSDECRHSECKSKKKSGIHDKATSNIVSKETWPQRNLMEDWADEEVEFCNLTFEQFVAGETKMIQEGTDPAQILGRLQLMRRMAYLKLRGFDWSLVRKMYAAILRAIETKELKWSDPVDRYENMLYRKLGTNSGTYTGKTRDHKEDKNPQHNKKWFCRDWNRDGCTKAAPHKAAFGSGQNTVYRQVLHMCAACYLKDKQVKDHTETSDACPHKE